MLNRIIILSAITFFSTATLAMTCPKEKDIHLNKDYPARWVTSSGWISSNSTTSPDFGPKKFFYAAFSPNIPLRLPKKSPSIKGIIGPCNYTNGELEIAMYPPETSAEIRGKIVNYKNGHWFSDVEPSKLQKKHTYYSHYICYDSVGSCKFDFIPANQSLTLNNPFRAYSGSDQQNEKSVE